ncbi:hypothetical protein [Oceanobacillus bengalensis]|uniref:Uncharacterized protein n=1 Tax=Oceanobacillus bengalensis TaxID=1435466 RepID=A0A494YRS5_9BACI|nr:hypothetical protein [Oceanobacillus bengalensis]RKQ12262.1 hypothetical protein D8M05_18725 [Oceanobacillus bengalensis]
MNNNSYNIVVHVVNLILLGAIGFLVFFSVVNISPAQDPIGDMFKFGHTVFLLVMWAVNYWFQYKKKKWILPIAGTILYVAIALFVMGVVSPFLRNIIEAQF